MNLSFTLLITNLGALDLKPQLPSAHSLYSGFWDTQVIMDWVKYWYNNTRQKYFSINVVENHSKVKDFLNLDLCFLPCDLGKRVKHFKS